MTPWTSHQVIAGPHRDKQQFTHYLHNLQVSGLWEEAGEPRQNSRRQKDNIQNSPRKDPGQRTNTLPLAKALTTTNLVVPVLLYFVLEGRTRRSGCGHQSGRGFCSQRADRGSHQRGFLRNPTQLCRSQTSAATFRKLNLGI